MLPNQKSQLQEVLRFTAIEMYVTYITLEQRNKTLKESSFKTYNSYIKMLRLYNDIRKKPIVYYTK